MKKLSLLIIPILLMFFASGLLWAEAGDHNLRFGLKYIAPTSDFDYTFVDMESDGTLDYTYFEQGTLEADDALGFGIGYEYMVTDLIGIDFNLNYAQHDMDFVNVFVTETISIDGDPIDTIQDTLADETIGDTSLMPITIGANFHVFQSDTVDFYLGPFVGYVIYSDISLNHPEPGEIQDITLKSGFGYGAAFGLDVPFGGQGWMFSTVLKYLVTSAEIDEPGTSIDGWDIDIDPVILQVGVGYKW